MPTLFKDGPYRFFVYSNEGASGDLPEVHVAAGMKVATFLYGRFDTLDRDPVLLENLTSSRRMRTGEIARLHGVVERHRKTVLEMWHDGSRACCTARPASAGNGN